MLTREQLQSAAADSGFPIDSLEKVWMLVRLLDMMVAHPFMGPRVALKGGTALNLFVFDVPRLSVDIDVNYVGAADRATMTVERPKLDAALKQVASRLGLAVKRAPSEHAGGKWRLSYTSALGRPAILEVDVNYMLRVPLWPPTLREPREFLGDRARQIQVLDDHELAFLDRLNGKGDIEASLLTADADLRQRIAANPGLRWKALNVKKHVGGD